MNRFSIFNLTVFVFLCGCSSLIPEQSTSQWQPLLDTSLSNWDNYLSYRHQVDYDGTIPKDSFGNEVLPIGSGKNAEHQVFTVNLEDDEPVLRISGEIYGAITTKQEFKNYHLKAKVKWGDIKWDPRKNLLKDSGILYHAIGPNGAEHWRSWMLSQEFQIMQGHMGDYWSQANSAIDIRAFIPEYIMSPAADLSQDFLAVGQGEQVKGYVMRSVNTESPNGEWTELELITMNGKSLHIVNGVVVMALKNSRYVDNEIAYPLTQGKIQIQSEAAEVFFKDIWIKPLQEMPDKYKEIFLE